MQSFPSKEFYQSSWHRWVVCAVSHLMGIVLLCTHMVYSGGVVVN